MKTRFACGSMVRDLSFSRNVGSKSQHFVKKICLLRPAGGEMSFQVCDRVTRVIDRTYAVRMQTERLLPIMASFASGNVVLFYLFPEHVALRATCSGKRNDIFRPAGGESGRSSR
jgi:hypothetical protein